MRLRYSLRKLGRDHLFSFGILDGIYLIGLYALGSYLPLDPVINILVFALCYYLTTSEIPSARKTIVFLISFAFVTMTISGALVCLLPMFTPANVNLRVVHQIGSKYALLIMLPYLILHTKTQAGDQTAFSRWTARLGWLSLKVSFWIGAYVALLTDKGMLIPFHIVFLVLALPLLVCHVVPSFRRMRMDKSLQPEVRPFAFFAIRDKRIYPASALFGILLIALIGFTKTGAGWEFLGSEDYMIQAENAVFYPSPAQSNGNLYYKAELMGKSNKCGVRACHPNVYAEWIESRHRNSVSPKYMDDVETVIKKFGMPSARVCAGCHDPISLFSGALSFGGDLFAPEARREGISCLVCHCLFPSSEDSGNGSLTFRFPRYYYRGPLSLITFVAAWKEHRADFLATDYEDDRLCISCHRIKTLKDPDFRELNEEWLLKDYHRQPKLIAECRQDKGCLKCHMPRTSTPEKPGGRLPNHRFRVEGAGGRPEP